MVEDLRHTSAAEVQAFLAKTDAEQKLEIWLNGKETNGHVAEAFERIDAMGLEVQKARIALSDHVQDHLTPKETTLLREVGGTNDGMNTARLEMWKRVNDMWQWFTVGRVAVIGFLALQPLVLWLVTR